MRKTRIFIDDEDHDFIMKNKKDSGVSMQSFITSAIKHQIAILKKELLMSKLKKQ